MTNGEILRNHAVKALDANLLSGNNKAFIGQIRNYDKSKLKKLSTKQYTWLEDIVRLHAVND